MQPPSLRCRLADIQVANTCELVDQPLVGLSLEVIKEADGLGFEAGLAWVGVWDEGIDLDAEDTSIGVNPSREFDTASWNCHASPVQKMNCHQFSELRNFNPCPDDFAWSPVRKQL